MAIETGLHSSQRNSTVSDIEKDRRSRVFWSAYILEITLAYNLGRPPGISNDWITATLPELEDYESAALYLIRHRLIQNKIITAVYCTNTPDRIQNQDAVLTIQRLQSELDQWHLTLQEAANQIHGPYTLRYHLPLT